MNSSSHLRNEKVFCNMSVHDDQSTEGFQKLCPFIIFFCINPSGSFPLTGERASLFVGRAGEAPSHSDNSKVEEVGGVWTVPSLKEREASRATSLKSVPPSSLCFSCFLCLELSSHRSAYGQFFLIKQGSVQMSLFQRPPNQKQCIPSIMPYLIILLLFLFSLPQYFTSEFVFLV